MISAEQIDKLLLLRHYSRSEPLNDVAQLEYAQALDEYADELIDAAITMLRLKNPAQAKLPW